LDHWERRDLPPALLTAQQRLNRIREQYWAQEQLPRPDLASSGRTEPQSKSFLSKEQSYPGHLGWGSVPLTKALRKTKGRGHEPTPKKIFDGALSSLAAAARSLPTQEETPATSTNDVSDVAQVKLFPDIALGMLGKKVVAPGRLWLLLQHVDSAGSGRLSLPTAREILTDKESSLRICGRRQLRKLLAQGEGLFWTKDGNRVWLRSVAKVAAALGVARLQSRPVSLPVTVLLQGIGGVRAHFFASFHSGRQGNLAKECGLKGERTDPRPISRATLQKITHVKPRTQRHYEGRAAVCHRRNYAIIQQSNTADIQRQAWRRGRAWFRYTDYRGRHGLKGRIYSAWQLPNSYWGPHEPLPSGRRKKINREIVDLFMKGMTGNGNFLNDKGESSSDFPTRRFYKSGATAASRYNRGSDNDIYWRSRRGDARNYAVWHCLAGRE
jgi:hypothetical protein